MKGGQKVIKSKVGLLKLAEQLRYIRVKLVRHWQFTQ